MAGNLDRRLSQLEDKAGGRGRMWYVIDMKDVPRDYGKDRALAELGIEATNNDVVVCMRDPTCPTPPVDGKPKLLEARGIA